MPSDIELRPYQTQSVEALRDGLRGGHRNQILCAPTAAGKTVIGAYLLQEVQRKETRAAFLVDRVALCKQTSDLLWSYGIRHGVAQSANTFGCSERIQVCSAQTIEKRGFWPGLDLLIVDEAHSQRKATLEHIRALKAPVIGLTATPFTKGMGKTYSNVVNVCTTNELLRDGWLAPLEVYVAKEIDMTGAKITAGEWRASEVEKRGKEIVGDIIREWVDKTNQHFGGPVKTIVFSATVAHGAELCQEWQAAGYRFEQISYRDSDDKRAALIKEFRKSDSDIVGLVSCDALAKGFDCFDSETEILTPSGWRGIGQFSDGDSVYGLNRETGRVEVVEVEGYGERDLRPDERMVTIQSQRFNIRTTEGHEFHIKYRDPGKKALSDNFITKTALDMTRRRSAYSIPISAECDFPGVPLSDDELRLIAWFMTDGSIYRQTFEICQSKIYKHEIRDLLVRLGLDFRERVVDSSSYPNGQPATRFAIPKGTHSGSRARNGWGKYAEYLDKGVSVALMAMSREQFRVFWKELLKGDGAQQGNKAGWLWCDRKEQADAYTHLAVVRGFATSFSIQKTASGKPMYVVSARDAQWVGTYPPSKLAAKFVVDDRREGEKVWCIRNRLSTVITRRGGKIAIVGNCPDIRCGVSARPYRKSFAAHIQQIGRAMRSYPGKEYALWLDHAGNYLGFMDQMEAFFEQGVHSLDDGEKKNAVRKERAKEHTDALCLGCGYVLSPEMDVCPSCGKERKRKNRVVALPGEMVAMGDTKPKGCEHAFLDDHRSVWYQFCTIALHRKHGDEEAALRHAKWMYKNAYDAWPNDRMWGFSPAPVTPEVEQFVESNKVRWGKRAAKAIREREHEPA